MTRYLKDCHPLDMVTMDAFLLECCEADEDGEIIFNSSPLNFHYLVDKNGRFVEGEPPVYGRTYEGLSKLVIAQIEKTNRRKIVSPELNKKD